MEILEIHSSARRHGVDDEDIEHAIENAELLEVVTLVREDASELVIHAMKMRPKYRRLLPGD